MRIQNRVTEILGTPYPLLQGPMRSITLSDIAASVANSGGFGQIAASGLSRERLLEEVKRAQKLTDKSFGINIPLHRPIALDAIEIAIEMGIKTITTSGADPTRVMDRIKKAGLKVLHKVSTLNMGLKAEAAGVDGVIATGYEAGGHIGQEDVTTFCLVPQLANVLKIPVIAAGGIADARGLLAALALGAEGVEVGTRFLATRECPVPEFFKQLILQAGCESTTVLGRKKGKVMPVRVFRSKAAEMINKVQDSQVPNGLTDRLFAEPKTDTESLLQPCGQAAGLCREIRSVEEVFPEMMEEASFLSVKLYSLFKGGD